MTTIRHKDDLHVQKPFPPIVAPYKRYVVAMQITKTNVEHELHLLFIVTFGLFLFGFVLLIGDRFSG